jgi:hypothetical protein
MTDNNPKLPIYKGPTEFSECKGDGCSRIASKTSANLYGVSYKDVNPQNAWYKKAAVLKGGGKVVWDAKESKDFSNVQVGDFVSLDRPGNDKKNLKSPIKGYSLKDNETNEHVGVIIGKNKDGKLLVKHGSENGKSYVQPIDNLFLHEYGFNYKPVSIYRPKSLEGKKLFDKRYYQSKGVDEIHFSESYIPSDNETKFLKSLNSSSEIAQQTLGISEKDEKMLRKLSFAMFENESKGGKTKVPIGGKMILADLANKLGFKKTSTSLGDIQLKYDDIKYNKDKSISKAGKLMDEMGVTKEGLGSYINHRKNYDDEAKASMAIFGTNLKKILNNPSKYKYDSNKGTVYGDIPIQKALLGAYHLPSSLDNEKLLREKSTYGESGMKQINKLIPEKGEVREGFKKPSVKEILLKSQIYESDRKKEIDVLMNRLNLAKDLGIM